MSTAPTNCSNGYETLPEDFMSIRSKSGTGVSTVQGWAESLPRGGAILVIGCGHGIPISKALVDEEFAVYGRATWLGTNSDG